MGDIINKGAINNPRLFISNCDIGLSILMRGVCFVIHTSQLIFL